jgi:Flp pilus assembly protein TadG
MNHPSFHARSVTKIGIGFQRGQATIEFAFVFILLMVMVFSIIEMVLFMHTYNVLADSAKEGVRYAIVHGANNSSPMPPAATCTSASCSCPCVDIDGPPAPPGTNAGYGSGYGVVRTFAQYSLHDVSGTNMTVNVTYGPGDPAPDGPITPLNKPPNRVQVVVSYPYKPFFGMGWPTITVNAAAEGRIMN